MIDFTAALEQIRDVPESLTVVQPLALLALADLYPDQPDLAEILIMTARLTDHGSRVAAISRLLSRISELKKNRRPAPKITLG